MPYTPKPYDFDTTDDLLHDYTYLLTDLAVGGAAAGSPLYEKQVRDARDTLGQLQADPNLSDADKKELGYAFTGTQFTTREDPRPRLRKINREGTGSLDDYFDRRANSSVGLHDALHDQIADMAKSNPDTPAWKRKAIKSWAMCDRLADLGYISRSEALNLRKQTEKIDRNAVKENPEVLTHALSEVGYSAHEHGIDGGVAHDHAADIAQQRLDDYQTAVGEAATILVDTHDGSGVDRMDPDYLKLRGRMLDLKEQLRNSVVTDEAWEAVDEAENQVEVANIDQAMDAVALASSQSPGTPSPELRQIDTDIVDPIHENLSTSVIAGFYRSPYVDRPGEEDGVGMEAYADDIVDKLPGTTPTNRAERVTAIEQAIMEDENGGPETGYGILAEHLRSDMPVVPVRDAENFTDGMVPSAWGLSEPGYGRVRENRTHVFRTLDGENWESRSKFTAGWSPVTDVPPSAKMTAPSRAARELGGSCIACGKPLGDAARHGGYGPECVKKYGGR